MQSAAPAPKAYTGKKIKTGFYIDKGSRGGGVIHLARLLTYSPQIELTLLKGEDLRKGKLNGLDMIVMPGGSSQLQMESMGPAGVKALQDFVRKGGIYVGICAGFHITLNRPERAQLMPYTYIREAVGARGDVQIELSKEAMKALDVKRSKHMVRYSRGPVAKAAQWNKGACKTFALYKSSIGPLNRAGQSFFNTPAMIAGTYGKGKVIATSFHPEYKPTTYELFVGCVYAVTGRKITPQIPGSVCRPLQVAYNTGSAMSRSTAQAIRETIELEASPLIQLHLGMNHDNLNFVDVLVLPDTSAAAGKAFIKNDWPKFLKVFMDKGRKVVAAGPAWKDLPAHKNLIRIPAKASLRKAVEALY
jgi:glutamine amidotransferase-like uncharacterized protein